MMEKRENKNNAEPQQSQALKYFDEHATDWEAKAGGLPDEVNVIKQRNDFVLLVAKHLPKNPLCLDVGCGTGELACELSKMGADAVGVDYSEKMNKIARSKRCGARFECASVFDFEWKNFDLVSANGFIEYISLAELKVFLSLCRKGLKTGGSLVIGSRNRLFNLFSANRFTKEEIENGTLSDLGREAIKLCNATKISDLNNIAPLQFQPNLTEHPITGIPVSSRYQYTPLQLIYLMRKYGFEPVRLYPIHIHGIPPRIKDKNPKLHTAISNLLQTHACDDSLDLIPHASSFMIWARKR